jgi:predicted nucleic acid-binding protein
VTVYELWVGRTFSRDEEAFFQSAFLLLEELVLTPAAAKTAALWLRNRPDLSEKLFRDALIAATAGELNAGVCSRNLRDFQQFPVEVRPY